MLHDQLHLHGCHYAINQVSARVSSSYWTASYASLLWQAGYVLSLSRNNGSHKTKTIILLSYTHNAHILHKLLSFVLSSINLTVFQTAGQRNWNTLSPAVGWAIQAVIARCAATYALICTQTGHLTPGKTVTELYLPVSLISYPTTRWFQ